jgi:hypothetical protein
MEGSLHFFLYLNLFMFSHLAQNLVIVYQDYLLAGFWQFSNKWINATWLFLSNNLGMSLLVRVELRYLNL